MKQLSGHQSQDVSITGLSAWNDRVLSNHGLKVHYGPFVQCTFCPVTVLSALSQLRLRSEILRVFPVYFVPRTILLIISPPPSMPTSVTGSPGTGHRLLVPVSTRINEQEVEQAGCCIKATPGPYATKMFTLTQYG